jgi:hypothetical protein
MKRKYIDSPSSRLSSKNTAPSRALGAARQQEQPRKRILRALAPVLIFSITSVVTQWTWFYSQSIDSSYLRHERLGLVNFVEDESSLWGVYSIHNQMEKYGMLPTVDHVVVVTSETSQETKSLLKELLGPGHIRDMDKNYIMDKVHDSLRPDEFVKTEAFNMVHYDKLIVIDSNTLIRKNLMHWFELRAPAATQAKGTMEWVSGAMLIRPNKSLYITMLEYLPLSRRWIPKQDNGKDTWNSGDTYQGFLSSFFLSKATNENMVTMDYGNFVQCSDMEERKENQYFWRYRNNSIETFHFDKAKPWKKASAFAKHSATCAMLIEWAESVKNAPADKLPNLPQFLSRCETIPNAEWAKRYA